MRYTWLGQGGFFFQFENGPSVLVDPYLSNSVPKKRRMEVDPQWFSLQPDIILCTHNHLDHTDPESLIPFLNRENTLTLLASHNAWETVRGLGFSQHNYVELNAGREWTQDGLHLLSVPAAHSDSCAVGFVLTYEGKRYYITGDTLYQQSILDQIPRPVHGLFVCINGTGNNMNMTDAGRFSQAVSPHFTVPMHFGLFDALDPQGFIPLGKNVKIPQLGKETNDESY